MDDLEELMIVDRMKEEDLVMNAGVVMITLMIEVEALPMGQDLIRHRRFKTSFVKIISQSIEEIGLKGEAKSRIAGGLQQFLLTLARGRLD